MPLVKQINQKYKKQQKQNIKEFGIKPQTATTK